MNEPVSSAVQEVLDLFAGELAHLRFGDLESGVLALAADEVKAVALEVIHAETVLEAARARLAEKQDALLQKAQRALAYARVYAEGQPDLAARLEPMALPRGARRALKAETSAEIELVPSADSDMVAARRRGRPRKVDTGATLLALNADGALDSAAADDHSRKIVTALESAAEA